MKEFLHFDPLNLAVVLFMAAGGWFYLVRDVKWHTKWIEKHQEASNKRETTIDNILVELRLSNEHLATMVKIHDDRVDKQDAEIIRLRDRQHDLAGKMQGIKGGS